MCLQDVKLGRAKTTTVRLPSIDMTIAVQIVGRNNPNRSAYLITAAFDDGVASTARVYVHSGGAEGPLIAQLTPYAPMLFLRVEDWGDVVFRPLCFSTNTEAETSNVAVCSVEWAENVDAIASWG